MSKRSEIEESYTHHGPSFCKERKSLKTSPSEEFETIIFIMNKTKAVRNKNLLFFCFPCFYTFSVRSTRWHKLEVSLYMYLHKKRPVTSHHLSWLVTVTVMITNVKCFCLFILIFNAVTVLYLVITFTVIHFLFEGTDLMKQEQFIWAPFCVLEVHVTVYHDKFPYNKTNYMH